MHFTRIGKISVNTASSLIFIYLIDSALPSLKTRKKKTRKFI